MSSEAPHTAERRDVWLPLLQSRLDIDQIAAVTGLERQDRVQTVDTELAFLENALRVGRKARNRLVPAGSLPAEILSQILTVVRAIWIPECTNEDNQEPTYNLGWIYVTHVCSLWREIALGMPSLWAALDNHVDIPIEMVPLIQERSKDLPLSLTFDLVAPYGPEMGVLLTVWMPDTLCLRLRSLKLVNVPQEAVSIAWPYVVKAFGSLTHLSLRMQDGEDDDENNVVMQIPEYVYALVQRPGLLELCLEDCLPLWTTPDFCTTLTYLELVRCYPIEDHLRPTFQQLSSMLSHMCSLERLRLRDVFPQDTPRHRTYSIVLQPEFKKMEYELTEAEDISPGLAFLSQLALPPLSVSSYELACYTQSPVEQQICSEAMISAFRRVSGVDVQFVEMIVQQDRVLFARVERDRHNWTTRVPSHGAQHDPPGADFYRPGETTLLASCYYIEGGRVRQLPLSRYVFVAPLQDLRAIAFQRYAPKHLVNESLLAGLSAACSVRRLGVDMPGSGALFKELRTTMHENKSYRLFPLLDIIHIHEHRPLDPAHQPYNKSTEAECAPDLRELAVLVIDRHNGGAPLQEIAIESEFAQWAIWEGIRQFVPVTLLGE